MTTTLDELTLPEWGDGEWGDFDMTEPSVSPEETREERKTQISPTLPVADNEIVDRRVA